MSLIQKSSQIPLVFSQKLKIQLYKPLAIYRGNLMTNKHNKWIETH